MKKVQHLVELSIEESAKLAQVGTTTIVHASADTKVIPDHQSTYSWKTRFWGELNVVRYSYAGLYRAGWDAAEGVRLCCSMWPGGLSLKP